MLQILSLFIVILSSAGCTVTEVLRLEDRQTIGVAAMVEEVRDAPVIFVGELHDVAAHHALQLEVIKGVREKGKGVAIGLEMFEAQEQQALDRWVAGKLTTGAFKKIYQRNWQNLPWGLYEEIFLYAREHRIPLVGLNAPRAVVRQVSRRGFESLGEKTLRELPPGVTGEVSDAYLRFIGASYPSHGRKGKSFRYICEAQMLRNRFMAHGIAQYLGGHPEWTMVVLAGGGHARYRGGIPMELGSSAYRIILPAIPGGSRESTTVEDGHYLMLEPFDWLP